MRLAAYLRVSTVGQVDGESLPAQRKRIARWAKAGGHTIAERHWFEDAESGTKDTTVRVGLGDAIAAVRSGEAAGLVVSELDRFSRDMLRQELDMLDIWRAGGEVFSTSPSQQGLRDDPDDPDRKFNRRLAGILAERDKDQVVLRLRRGRESKAERGGYAGGAPPYGYMAHDGKLVHNPDEQIGLALIRQGSMRGAPLMHIVDELNRRGIKSKRGGRWHAKTVASVVRRLETR